MASSDNSSLNSYTDTVYQEILLFIEGIQVPYQAISVTSQAGGLPSAFLNLSPTLGLEDIARYYQPKVHIFYRDAVQKKICLLFAGQINNLNYSKSTAGSGHKEIGFYCTHKYSLIKDIQLIYSSYTQEGTYLNPNQGDATLQVHRMSSAQSLITAMKGVTSTGTNSVSETNPTGDPSQLPSAMSGFSRRLSGITGVFWNLWSQLKAQSYTYKNQSQAMTDVYIPLMEDGENSGGLQFFKRLAGHLVIEDVVENTREDGVLPNKTDVGKIVIPPALKALTQGGLSAEIMFRVLEQGGQFSNEVTNIYDMFEHFLSSFDYEMVFLNSPAEPHDSSGEAIDAIFKPQTPFYYSPICNVILPQLYESLQIEESDGSMPTRLAGMSSIPMSRGGEYFTFRGPASVREAIANGGDLSSTVFSSHDRVGKYEFGRGVKPISIVLPAWLSLFASYKQKNPDGTTSSVFLPSEVDALAKGWNARYGATNSKLNPWSVASGIPDYQRVLFATMDYKFSQAIASSRLGTVQSYFNPYVIAGYPLDVIDKDKDAPCYHGFCTSVSHSFTPGSMSTSISFVGAMSYDELCNYYVPPNHPWLDGILGLSASQSLVGNAEAKSKADSFYSQVLGVKSAAPDDLYDFANNSPIPVTLGSDGTFQKGSWAKREGSNGGELNPYLTYEGNLSMIYREIETIDSLSSRFGLSFIYFSDMDTNSTLRRFNHPTAGNTLRELGESKFLDY